MAVSFPPVDMIVNPTVSWPCIVCTYKNECDALKCELCLTPKPVIRNIDKPIIQSTNETNIVNTINTTNIRKVNFTTQSMLDIPFKPSKPIKPSKISQFRSKSIPKLNLSNMNMQNMQNNSHKTSHIQRPKSAANSKSKPKSKPKSKSEPKSAAKPNKKRIKNRSKSIIHYQIPNTHSNNSLFLLSPNTIRIKSKKRSKSRALSNFFFASKEKSHSLHHLSTKPAKKSKRKAKHSKKHSNYKKRTLLKRSSSDELILDQHMAKVIAHINVNKSANNSPNPSPMHSPMASPISPISPHDVHFLFPAHATHTKSASNSPVSRMSHGHSHVSHISPRQPQLYKLPAEKHKMKQNKNNKYNYNHNYNNENKLNANTNDNASDTTSRPSNFSFAASIYGELQSVLEIMNTSHTHAPNGSNNKYYYNRDRNQSLPALEMYEETVQKHESILLEILKTDANDKNVISDTVINTIIQARCDVLCQFLNLIAFTLIHNNNNESKWKLLNKLRDRIIGQSDLRQAVKFLVGSYSDIECVQSVFQGLCLDNIETDSTGKMYATTSDGSEFWYDLLCHKKIKENDEFIIPANMILRDPVKQLALPINKVVVRKVINSNSKPLLLSCYGSSKNMQCIELSTFILKGGDDLRKDKSCMLVFKWINHLFNKKNMGRIRILTYNVIPMSKNMGCIQLIPDCIALRDIDVLMNDINNNQKLLWNLISTAAGSYIASYIMGIRDRHFDNILIRTADCTLFHIDFNYCMGDTINGLDANKFGITREFYNILGKKNYQKFIDMACQAFMQLRESYKELINFACLSFSYIYPYKIIKKRILKQLRMNESDQKAIQWLKMQLINAPFNKQTKLKNVIHKFATR